jgi:hypothetical protein
LATSVETADGTWATIAMGHLDDPANTFWQLFFHPLGKQPLGKRPLGKPAWSDQVEATATATNGGLVLATAGGRSLTVGIRPSADLTYSPLITTVDSARSWSNGLVTSGLADRPDALATRTSGAALALVGGRGAQVLASGGDLSKWSVVVSESALAATSGGRSCGLGALTAVGYLSGERLVGGSCGLPGVVGVFAQAGRTWRAAGPALPTGLLGGRAEVLSLSTDGSGTSALVAVVSGKRSWLLAASARSGGRWHVSPALALGSSETVASFGPAGASGLFVLLQGRTGRPRLLVAPGAGALAWRDLPAPPAGTATVAFDGPAAVDALAERGKVLTVWSLGPGRAWDKIQIMNVPIQYGSSS